MELSAGTALPNPNSPPRHVGLFESPQSNPIVVSPSGLIYAVNTANDTVSVLEPARGRIFDEIPVGLDPVALAFRPDGRELWVSNHLSDSVSVIDTDWKSPTRHRVIDTIQDFDASGVTRFDEPVGIAFASDEKAYVALSSTNRIAIVDIDGNERRVRADRISIGAQDPRAIAVRDGRLYVAAFESLNQTEISICPFSDGTPQCTKGFADPIPPATIPAQHILIDPNAPDRDLFVFDTEDESPIDHVSHLGTLLYGMAVGAKGRVFVAHTDARNHVNGMQFGRLADLENRIYLNRIAKVDCGPVACTFDGSEDLWALEPAPGEQLVPGRQLATPYGIAISDDGRTIVATASASGRLFTTDAESGDVLDVLDVGVGPRGVALRSSSRSGAARRAYVLNTLDTSVTAVDVSQPRALRTLWTATIGEDPTPEVVRVGRIAFNDASASTSGTFACASCHPDAHTDQILWRIGGGGPRNRGQHVPRLTQPIRGLRHSVPLHWDGSLGDPFGGPNGLVGVGEEGGTDCEIVDGDDHACFLDLVMASLGAVMCDQSGDCPAGGNELSDAERDAMATYLASVWHPPAPLRPYDDRVSGSALDGFSDFHVDQGGSDPRTCGGVGCHSLPLLTGTNGLDRNLAGFDAPSLRGIHDRFALNRLSGTTTHEALAFFNDPTGLLQPPFHNTPPSEFPFDWDIGYSEGSVFAAGFMFFRVVHRVGPIDIFQMLGEASTGTSGATGRQVTLNSVSVGDEREIGTLSLLEALERADAAGAVELGGELTRIRRQWGRDEVRSARIDYDSELDAYRAGPRVIDREELIDWARGGESVVTLTARLPGRFGLGFHRQPLLALDGPRPGVTGNPGLPFLLRGSPNPSVFAIGIDVRPGAAVILDGERVAGEVRCVDGDFSSGFCSTERVEIALGVPFETRGLHLIQVQNPEGPFSNELPVCLDRVIFCR